MIHHLNRKKKEGHRLAHRMQGVNKPCKGQEPFMHSKAGERKRDIKEHTNEKDTSLENEDLDT